MISHRVAKMLRQTPESEGPHRLGVVTQVSPLLVRVGYATTATPARKLASYTPVVTDSVIVLVSGADRVVLGKIG